jgi:hypothetical protein
MNDMITATLDRLLSDLDAYRRLRRATNELHDAAVDIGNTDHPSNRRAFIEAESLEHLAQGQQFRMGEIAAERAAQLGWQVATYIIAPMAKTSGDEAVTFITGNSYMPPLRDIGPSEDIWLATSNELELWNMYSEAIETRLDELQVYMASPEDDNSLYVVDLERFKYVDSEGHEVFGGGAWEAI